MKALLLSVLFAGCVANASPGTIKKTSASAIKRSTVMVKCLSGHGSGTIIGHTKLATIILTADHVADGCGIMTVNGQVASKVVRHAKYDIALAWVPGDHGPEAQMRLPIQGERILVAGFPADNLYDNSPYTVTAGIVSAFVAKGVFKTDSFLQPGVSGGGAWSEDGYLIGVATHGMRSRMGISYYCFFAVIAVELLDI